MELDNLGSAESFPITVTRLPEGKFSVRSGTSQIETAIFPISRRNLRHVVFRGTFCELPFYAVRFSVS